MLEQIDAVIFDLDGTLADSMDVWVKIDRKFFADRQMPYPEDLNKAIEGMSFLETAEYFEKTYDIPETAGELMELWTRQAIDQYAGHVELKPGAREFLEFLSKRKIRVGIATSNSRELLTIFLHAKNLDPLIRASVTSEDVVHGKPDPEFYLKAAKLLGVSPERCLVFEDIPNGILAGKNAGMMVCAVEDSFSAALTEEKRRLADYYICDYYELLNLK